MTARGSAAAVLAVAAVFYSAWLLVFVLPTGLSLVHAYVSELSADGQPFHVLFRVTDLVAGSALLASVPFLARLLPSGWPMGLVLGGMVLFGAGVLLGALFSLDCSSSLSEACRLEDEAGSLSLADTMHVASSAASNFGMFFAALGAERLASGVDRVLLRIVLAVVAVTGLAIVVLNPLGPGHFAGLVLQVQLVVVALALFGAAYRLLRAGTAGGRGPRGG
ncbi:DUF998 domain-containing protein [Amycolatopsis anabasis]|uniref:DUF998 domain-containing protein n=1 Tax=Amycolatopsis anabasis TaxID=1840409 RepID=UPI00131BE83C|nr:DUF998 domain-containing protein [Amycolatopsis anabasis]